MLTIHWRVSGSWMAVEIAGRPVSITLRTHSELMSRDAPGDPVVVAITRSERSMRRTDSQLGWIGSTRAAMPVNAVLSAATMGSSSAKTFSDEIVASTYSSMA